MDDRLQRRIQRYGWDRAAPCYEALWRAQLAPVQARLLEAIAVRPGEQVLDVACGTGLVSLAAARATGARGTVLGTDLSQEMVDAARRRARLQGLHQAHFQRMDAQHLDVPDAAFDVALCSLGLMYLTQPEGALQEMWRVLRPGGRVAIAGASAPAADGLASSPSWKRRCAATCALCSSVWARAMRCCMPAATRASRS